jgi:tRNA G37 N-methylase Trm5
MKLLVISAAALLGLGGLYAGSSYVSAPGATAQAVEPDFMAELDFTEPDLMDEPDVSAERSGKPDVVYVPTPQRAVERMLEMAGVGEGDILYDLGSGDGRIPITAARKHGIRAVGIDIDPQRIAESRANAKAAGVSDLVTFREEDLFEADFSEATVVTLYLLQRLNEKLKPRLLSELKPGTRIVSHAFTMGPDWPPEQIVNVDGSGLYLWTVPERK